MSEQSLWEPLVMKWRSRVQKVRARESVRPKRGRYMCPRGNVQTQVI